MGNQTKGGYDGPQRCDTCLFSYRETDPPKKARDPASQQAGSTFCRLEPRRFQVWPDHWCSHYTNATLRTKGRQRLLDKQ